MNNPDLINALRNEGRQPVDLNLGQVPVSPTIGRMGAYNVIVKGYSNRNAATEISSALAQMPQLLGQARNIQETAGKQAANELTTEQVIDRFHKGDLEAEGFLTQFGKDKAFAEQVYQRWFDSTIKASIINASSQIDNKSPEELLEMGEGDVFSNNARDLLVNAITRDDADLLQKIADNPHTARLHNKAMEGVIPEFTAKATATAEARKQAFARESALNNVSNDLLSLTDVDVLEYVKDETHDDAQHKVAKAKYETEQLDAYVNNFQESLTTALSNPDISTEDKNDAVKEAVGAMQSRMSLLLEHEDIDEYAALVNAMNNGSLKINERPLSQTKEGMRLLLFAETSLQQYEDKLERENERGDFSREKVDKFKVYRMRTITEPIYGEKSATPAAFQTGIDELNALRSLIMGDQSFSSTEKEHLFETVGDKISSLKAARDGRLDDTLLMKASPDYRRLQVQTGLGAQDFVTQQTANSAADLQTRAEEYGITDEMASLMTKVYTSRGDEILQPDTNVFAFPEQAHNQAMANVLNKPFQDLQDGALDLDSPEKIKVITEAYHKEYQNIYTDLFKEFATKKGFIQGDLSVSPKVLPEDLFTDEEREEQARQDFNKDSVYPLRDGKITYKRGTAQNIPGDRGNYGPGRMNYDKIVDSENAWKMVNDEEAVKVFRTNNLESERLEFNKIWLNTKYRKQAKHERAVAIMKEPSTTRSKSKLSEIEQSRSTGLPMEILRTDQGLSESYYFDENKGFSGYFGFPGEKITFPINYGFNGELTNKDAPEKRLFNVNAVYKAVRKNDFEDIIFIAVEYGHAPKGSSIKSPKIQDFLNKQKILVSKYGYMDFVAKPTKTEDLPKGEDLKKFEELKSKKIESLLNSSNQNNNK